jgi:hypothetical protein
MGCRRAYPLRLGGCGNGWLRDWDARCPTALRVFLTANSKFEIDWLWPTRDCGPGCQSLSVLTNCSSVVCRSSSAVGSPMGTGDGASLGDTAIALRPWG